MWLPPQEVADQRVSDELMKVAMMVSGLCHCRSASVTVFALQNSRFRRSRQKHNSKGRGPSGQRARPGLGATKEVGHRV